MSRPKAPWKLSKMDDLSLDEMTAVIVNPSLSMMTVTLRDLRRGKVLGNSCFRINVLLLTHAPCRRRKCLLAFVFAVLSSAL